jgi:hypothetical protein
VGKLAVRQAERREAEEPQAVVVGVGDDELALSPQHQAARPRKHRLRPSPIAQAGLAAACDTRNAVVVARDAPYPMV